MGKLMKEFRDFAVKGNMLDMAVGMIIGAAFKDIVNSVVNDLIMPVVGLFTGRIDFSNMFIALDGNKYATLAAAQEAAAPTLNYGLFINQVINFVILAFVIFMMVKWVNKIRTSVEPKKEEDMAEIAHLVWLAATDFENKADEIRAAVTKICEKYPIYE